MESSYSLKVMKVTGIGVVNELPEESPVEDFLIACQLDDSDAARRLISFSLSTY